MRRIRKFDYFKTDIQDYLKWLLTSSIDVSTDDKRMRLVEDLVMVVFSGSPPIFPVAEALPSKGDPANTPPSGHTSRQAHTHFEPISKRPPSRYQWAAVSWRWLRHNSLTQAGIWKQWRPIQFWGSCKTQNIVIYGISEGWLVVLRLQAYQLSGS